MNKCPNCNTTYREILQTGFVGCEECYKHIDELAKAVKELYDGKIKILQDDEEVDFDDSLDLDGEMDDIAEAGDEESDEIDFEGEAGEAGESTNETEE